MFVPYVRLQQAEDFRRPFEDARLFSAHWRTYFASSALRARMDAANHSALERSAVPRVHRGHRGCGRPRDRVGLPAAIANLRSCMAGLAALAFWASLGPDAASVHRTDRHESGVHVHPRAKPTRRRRRVRVVRPGRPLRFRRCSRDSKAGRRQTAIRSAARSRRTPAVVAALLAGAAVAELTVPLSFSRSTPTEPAYRALAALPRGPVIEIPFYSTRFAAERTRYMLASTTHWMPLVNGFSSHVPRDVLENTPTLGGFPSREAFQILKRDRVRYAVFHMHTLNPAARATLIARLRELQSLSAPSLRGRPNLALRNRRIPGVNQMDTSVFGSPRRH